MMVFPKKSMLFLTFVLITYYSQAQTLSTDSVHFPSQKIYLSNGYYSMGAEGHSVIYEVSYKKHSGVDGIETVWLDIKFTNNANTRYCFTRPNESVDCYRKTGGIGKLNDLRQPSVPALAYIDFSYDIYYKDKFLRSTGDNSDKYIGAESSEPITIQINIPPKEVNKNTKLEDILKNVSIKNLQIREYTFGKEVKDYLYALSELDYTVIEKQNKQAEIERKKAQLVKEEELKKTELEKKKLAMAKGLEKKAEELEKQKTQLPTKQTEETRIAEDKRKAEDDRIAEEKRKAEGNRIAEEKPKTEDSRIVEEKRKTEDNRIAEEKRKTEDNRIAEEKLRIAQEKLNLSEEKLRFAEEKLRASEGLHNEDAKFISMGLKYAAVDSTMSKPILTVKTPLHVNRFRLTGKALVPNILGFSLELVPRTSKNKLGLVVDYSNLNASNLLSTVIGEDVDGSVIKYNYAAFGTNIYLNKKRRAGGPYLGLRYQIIKISETQDGDTNPDFEGKQNAVALLFGLTTAGHVSFGLEIGASMPIGNFTGYQIQTDKNSMRYTETISESFSNYFGVPVIPVLNLKLGFAF